MKSFLAQIVKCKQKEIKALKTQKPLAILKKEVLALPRKRPGCFLEAIKNAKRTAIIAEIKRKSPSKGILRRAFDPAAIARAYKKGGACALSVLTDRPFFGGCASDVIKAKRASRLAVLRKDFIIQEYQVWESRALGADAILLIAAILKKNQLKGFLAIAQSLGLDALIEIHSQKELKKVLPLKPRLVGINNRDLKTFKVDLHTTERLAPLLPKGIVSISESGIKTGREIGRLRRAGVRAVLVGEGLMAQENIKQALRKLRSDAL